MKVLLLITGLMLLNNVSMAQTGTFSDGPYIFYRHDTVEVLTIHEGAASRSYSKQGKKQSLNLQVPRPGTTDHFNVAVKKEISDYPSEYSMPSKIFVLSDVEGEFQSFTQLLQQAGVVDTNLAWNFGNGHLVICGDMLDRGSEVTSCLWLLYKLEDEAARAGGQVHVIIGNHEVMNLSEDIRYVHPKYIQAAAIAGINYNQLYADNTELGKWLRSKNCIEKIGDYLFLHGGVSPEITRQGYSLAKINKKAKLLYDKDGFDDVIRKEGATLIFHTLTSPFWYRGYFAAPKATPEQVDSTLQLYGVRRIMVGHTLVDKISSLYDGRVIALDVNDHKGGSEGLLIENREYYRITKSGYKEKLSL